LDQIANLGYDPVYGARPLKRAIQNCIENPLAQEVLKGTFLPGDIISLDLNDEAEFVFEKG
jgi:ATP-dependent Clp protease ATP-binding subunit ClpB